MNRDLARGRAPPNIAQPQERGDPKPLHGQRAHCVHAAQLAQINLQRRERDVLEGKPCGDFLNDRWKIGHRDEQAAQQFNQPILRANQREDGRQRNRTGANHEIDGGHQQNTSGHRDDK